MDNTGGGSGCGSTGVVAVLTATSAVAWEVTLVDEGSKVELRLGGRVA